MYNADLQDIDALHIAIEDGIESIAMLEQLPYPTDKYSGELHYIAIEAMANRLGMPMPNLALENSITDAIETIIEKINAAFKFVIEKLKSFFTDTNKHNAKLTSNLSNIKKEHSELKSEEIDEAVEIESGVGPLKSSLSGIDGRDTINSATINKAIDGSSGLLRLSNEVLDHVISKMRSIFHNGKLDINEYNKLIDDLNIICGKYKGHNLKLINNILINSKIVKNEDGISNLDIDLNPNNKEIATDKKVLTEVPGKDEVENLINKHELLLGEQIAAEKNIKSKLAEVQKYIKEIEKSIDKENARKVLAVTSNLLRIIGILTGNPISIISATLTLTDKYLQLNNNSLKKLIKNKFTE